MMIQKLVQRDRARHERLRAILIAATAYAAIGITFPIPQAHTHAWRLAAWILSVVVFASHILYELIALRQGISQAARRVSLAAAMGAFGLALGGIMHDVLLNSSVRPTWYFALVALPITTGLPAFVVAWIIAWCVVRHRPRGD